MNTSSNHILLFKTHSPLNETGNLKEMLILRLAQGKNRISLELKEIYFIPESKKIVKKKKYGEKGGEVSLKLFPLANFGTISS